MQIWHNPKCSKSRQTLELLTEAGAEVQVRRYLEEPPTAPELAAVLERLDLQPWDLVRRGEAVFKDLGMRDWAKHDAPRWIAAMVANPKLIERPVVLADDGRAVVGRPPTNVHDLL
jgi:arsenate reductase